MGDESKAQVNVEDSLAEKLICIEVLLVGFCGGTVDVIKTTGGVVSIVNWLTAGVLTFPAASMA